MGRFLGKKTENCLFLQPKSKMNKNEQQETLSFNGRQEALRRVRRSW